MVVVTKQCHCIEWHLQMKIHTNKPHLVETFRLMRVSWDIAPTQILGLAVDWLDFRATSVRWIFLWVFLFWVSSLFEICLHEDCHHSKRNVKRKIYPMEIPYLQDFFPPSLMIILLMNQDSKLFSNVTCLWIIQMSSQFLFLFHFKEHLL